MAAVVTGQRVLVIGGLEETGEVLKAVLEPRGLQVRRIGASGDAGSPRADRPNVIVLHEETPALNGPEWKDVPRVFIGSARTSESPEQDSAAGSRPRAYLRNPFHYGELVAAIEQLLNAAR